MFNDDDFELPDGDKIRIPDSVMSKVAVIAAKTEIWEYRETGEVKEREGMMNSTRLDTFNSVSCGINI